MKTKLLFCFEVKKVCSYTVGQHDGSITNSYMDNPSVTLSTTQQGPDV